jgi:hypothetical protein
VVSIPQISEAPRPAYLFAESPLVFSGMTSSAEHLAVKQAVIGTMAAVMKFQVAFVTADLAAVLAADESFAAD